MLARPHKVKDREAIVRRAMEKQESHEMANCTKIFLGSPGGKVHAYLMRMSNLLCRQDYHNWGAG